MGKILNVKKHKTKKLTKEELKRIKLKLHDLGSNDSYIEEKLEEQAFEAIDMLLDKYDHDPDDVDLYKKLVQIYKDGFLGRRKPR